MLGIAGIEGKLIVGKGGKGMSGIAKVGRLGRLGILGIGGMLGIDGIPGRFKLGSGGNAHFDILH